MAKNKITRKQRVLDAMRTNLPERTITPFYAINYLGDTRLAATIHQLKSDGHEISKTMHKDKNKFGDEIWFAKYKLVKEAQ
jgi:hypothetical protein